MDSDITTEQRDHMMHAVGRLKISDKPRARARKLSDCYRNYFCSDEDPSWEDLIVKGYATRGKGNSATGGGVVYYVTDAGFSLLVRHHKSLLDDLSAAKERLRRFA
jgi:hypothetical protein